MSWPNVSRRQFIERSTAGAAVVVSTLNHAPGEALSANAAEPADNNAWIVDTHQHLWDLERFRLPRLAPGGPLTRSFLLRDYQQAAAGLDIRRTIYMEVDVAAEQKQAEADFVAGLCENHAQTRMHGAVVGARIGDAGFTKYVRQFRGHRYVKGVRQVAAVPLAVDGSLERRFLAGIRLLGEMNLSFDLCCPSDKLLDAERLIAACTDTRFILDHCGNADAQAKDQTAWKRAIDAIAKHERVVCKVSGIVATAGEKWSADDLAPDRGHVREAFGADRLMFGGDWPVCTKRATLRRWVEALREIIHDWPTVEQAKLFHGNAMRCYSLTA